MAEQIKDNVLEWYVDNYFHPNKLLDANRQRKAMHRTYPRDNVLWAMHQLYALVHVHGEEIKRINIARKTWALAGKATDDEIEQFRSGQNKWEDALHTISKQKRVITNRAKAIKGCAGKMKSLRSQLKATKLCLTVIIIYSTVVTGALLYFLNIGGYVK